MLQSLEAYAGFNTLVIFIQTSSTPYIRLTTGRDEHLVEAVRTAGFSRKGIYSPPASSLCCVLENPELCQPRLGHANCP